MALPICVSLFPQVSDFEWPYLGNYWITNEKFYGIGNLDAKFTDLGFRYAKYTVNPTQKQIHTKYTARYTLLFGLCHPPQE